MQTFKLIDRSQLDFHILPGNPQPGFAFRDLHDMAYRHYRDVWLRTMNRRAGEGVFDSYAFFRQNYIFLITYQGEVVAELFVSFHYLDSEIISDLPYFAAFKGKAFKLFH